MGVILAQEDDNDKEHPVLYLSKKISETEKKYSTAETECAAIIFAVKKLQCYLDGPTKFLIMTDPNPLVLLQNNVSLNPRLVRWALELQPYNYIVVHQNGKNHKNVDALSRIPWPD
ncbi:Retrovirus-related Pol polyprotein from transposon opus [Araneus ventricosus]|uniref:Retrovirus-related Pol polyprotein from transposon opus n=1 Tax=Araneus ventricosus TaxID=182803 RepID=A0A4Y2JAW0_ARAVE|nr:Retrovirus-related Pol polyprotein from transposon opus [Araneus ventricosus]